MWLRGAAIRPVPGYAVVTAQCLDRVERELASDAPRSRDQIDSAFARFESTQPELAQAVSDVLSQSRDDTALALGYFLSIAIWLAFDTTFGQKRLREASREAIDATDAAIDLEEELRAAHGGQPLDLDDIVSVAQPGVFAFVHRHVDSALTSSFRDGPDTCGGRRDAHACKERAESDDASSEPEARQATSGTNADDIRAVYRVIVLLVLCLSHAVVPVEGAAHWNQELLA
jgi:hypothetical protein